MHLPEPLLAALAMYHAGLPWVRMDRLLLKSHMAEAVHADWVTCDVLIVCG